MRRLLLLASACALSSTLPAAAQQPITELPETIVTATRIPTPAERVPAAVTVITRADIEERGYQTLAEALRAVPGMRVVQSGGVGQQSSGFLRGTESRHVLVLLDGVPINDPSTPNGAFNFGNDLLFDIERIEVVRGPASSLYGSGAIGGVINLISRRAAPGRVVQTYGEAAGGTQRTLRSGLGVMGQVGAADYLVSTNGLTTRGFDATPRRFAADTGERDGATIGAATARLGVQLDAASRVEALLRWRENRHDYDFISSDDPNLHGYDRRWLGQLRGDTTLLDGAWTTGLRLGVAQDQRAYRNDPDAGSQTFSRDDYRGQRTTLDWSNRVRLGDIGPLTESALAFGVTRTDEKLESDTGGIAPRFRVNASSGATAVRGGYQARIAERLDIALGLRHDAPEGFDGFTSWRAGGVYALPELSSRLLASAGTAYRAPVLDERFGRTAWVVGNPELRPETSFSWEVGAETDLPGLGRSDLATISATWFESRIRDLIDVRSVGGVRRPVNVGRAKIEGAELGLTLRPAIWLDATASWTITDAINEQTGERLLRRPQNAYAFSARVTPLPGLAVVPELVAAGAHRDSLISSAGDFGPRGTSPGGRVWNLTVTYAATEQINLFAEARNIGDSRYEPANGYGTPGRWVLLGTRFAF